MGFALSVSAAFVTAQSGDNSPWLIRFTNGVEVSQQEFEYVYQKNNGGWETARSASSAAYREYLDLYINFKRKVMAAEAAGLDTVSAFRKELDGYLDQLAQPYLIEQQTLDELVRQAYARSRSARRVSHLLISVDENASPKDTVQAYQRAQMIRDSIVNGQLAFDAAAKRHSGDPSAKTNSGYLSWFSAFDFVYPFENTAFNTPVGEVSQPVRSQFGYHLIKVHEEKDIFGQRRLAHILLRDVGGVDSLDAEERAKKVYQLLQDGEDFSTVASEYSDDVQTKQRGGDLGTRYMGVPELQDKRYELGVGEYSEPFESEYGWHIVMVTGLERIPNFEDVEQQLKARVGRDPRAQLAEDKFYATLSQEYSLEHNGDTERELYEAVEDNYTDGNFEGPGSVSEYLKGMTLLTFADQTRAVEDFLRWVIQQPQRARNVRGVLPQVALERELEQYTRDQLKAYERTQLARKYPDYRYLSQEYRDGILLFTLTEQEVWQHAVDDTMGLRAYWQQNQSEYQAPDRVRVWRFSGREKAHVEAALTYWREFDANRDSVNNKLRATSMSVRITPLVIEKAPTEELATRLYDLQEGESTGVVKKGVKFESYLVVEFREAGNMLFEEAKPQAITGYQEQLEAQWLERLANQYRFKLNKKAFKNLYADS